MAIVKNAVKQRLRDGKIAAGFGVSRLRTVEIPQIAKATGFHWVFVDLEHTTMDLDEAADQARLAVLHRAMDLCSGNVSEAARQLGTSRNKVYRLLEQERQRHTRANK